MEKNSYNGAIEFYGLSTETKPAGAKLGSVFFETDTGFTFVYTGSVGGWVKKIESVVL